MEKIAVPSNGGILSSHFGHCETFDFFEIEDGQISKSYNKVPPPHEPGVLPKWLAEEGANKILTGGMGQRAVSLLNQVGVEVLLGVKPELTKVVIEKYLKGSLEFGGNSCDH